MRPTVLRINHCRITTLNVFLLISVKQPDTILWHLKYSVNLEPILANSFFCFVFTSFDSFYPVFYSINKLYGHLVNIIVYSRMFMHVSVQTYSVEFGVWEFNIILDIFNDSASKK